MKTNLLVAGFIPAPEPTSFAVRVALADMQTASGRLVMRELMERALVIASTSHSSVMPVTAAELQRAHELGFHSLAGLRLVADLGGAACGVDAGRAGSCPGARRLSF